MAAPPERFQFRSGAAIAANCAVIERNQDGTLFQVQLQARKTYLDLAETFQVAVERFSAQRVMRRRDAFDQFGRRGLIHNVVIAQGNDVQRKRPSALSHHIGPRGNPQVRPCKIASKPDLNDLDVARELP